MNGRVTLDIPLNRVEGDLDVRVTLDGNRVIDAACVGTLYRGFENMLKGREAMDALVITPRICGICSVTHLMAAVKAIEQAAGIIPPPQAVRLRNASLLAETVQSDLRQVFLMFLPDFAHDFYQERDFHAEAVARYAAMRGEGCIEALRASKDIVRIVAIIGGQWPHTSHMVPGGICTLPSLMDLTLAVSQAEQVLDWYQDRVLGCSVDRFADEVTSVQALERHVQSAPQTHLAAFMRLCGQAGLSEYGHSHANFISYGAVDEPEQPGRSRIRGGVLLDGEERRELELDAIAEDLSHAWYRQTGVIQAPFDAETVPDRQQPAGYTWSKAPRYAGQAVQTGPLAEALIDGDPLLEALYRQQGDSVLLRELARLLRPRRYLPLLREQLGEAMSEFGQASYYDPGPLLSGRGAGLTEAARGALGHWLEMESGRIVNYQIITPTAWNASPKDQQAVPGPWEQALMGLELSDPKQPMEMGHVIRSFDPCLVCTVHALGDDGEQRRWHIPV